MSNLALGVLFTGLLVACACVYTFVTTDQLEWLAAGIGVVVALMIGFIVSAMTDARSEHASSPGDNQPSIQLAGMPLDLSQIITEALRKGALPGVQQSSPQVFIHPPQVFIHHGLGGEGRQDKNVAIHLSPQGGLTIEVTKSTKAAPQTAKVLTCAQCNAPLDVSPAASTVRCRFCGATNTLIHRNDA